MATANARLLQFFGSVRTYILLIVVGLYIQTNIQVLWEHSQMFGISVSAYGAFASAMSNTTFVLLVAIGWILLISNTPYVNRFTAYQLSRIHTSYWMIGTILSIIFLSSVYILIIFLMVGLFSGGGFFTFQWDKILISFSKSIIGYTSTFDVPARLLWRYSPVLAAIYSFFSMWMAFSILGLLMLLIGWIAGRIPAIIVCCFVCILDLSVDLNLPYQIYRYSLLSLARLSIPNEYSMWNPTPQYARITLMTSTIMLSIGCILVSQNQRVKSTVLIRELGKE